MAATLSLPAIETLPSLTNDDRARVLDLLFEPCDSLHNLSVPILESQSFGSYTDLIAFIGAQLTELSSSDTICLDRVLCAHPRLGEKRVDSAQSRAEQKNLNSSQDGQSHHLKALNEQYEKTFPSLRYVVFVNGRDRSIIMEDMQSRIKRGDVSAERADAIEAMCDIASDRARKLS